MWSALLLGYVLIQLGRRQGLLSGWVDWYLADLICMPILLGGVLMVQRRLRGSCDWCLPWWHGLLAAVAYGLYFEILLPYFKPTAVGDLWDIVCYLLGWVLFELLINRPA